MESLHAEFVELMSYILTEQVNILNAQGVKQ